MTYKPDWYFYILPNKMPFGEDMLLIEVLVIDADDATRSRRVKISHPTSIPLGMIRDEETAISFLHWCITKVELHERDEFFRIDGYAVKNPHEGEKDG